jgi:hypothetical protein
MNNHVTGNVASYSHSSTLQFKKFFTFSDPAMHDVFYNEYIPINIFLDPVNQNCVSDCSEAGEGYMNPFEYDPEHTKEYMKLAQTNEVVCAPGFIQLADKSCFDCKNLDNNCASCSGTTKETVTCDFCGSNLKMVAPDTFRCVDKIKGCKVPFD